MSDQIDRTSVHPGQCCDMHNQHCEPPGDLCCWKCTEKTHDTFPIGHADGSTCVLADLAARKHE